MPVYKYRSVEEMEDDRRKWHEPGTPELWRAIRTTWAWARRMAPRRYPPGVYKHRTIEDMNRQTEQWERDNIRRLREQRRK